MARSWMAAGLVAAWPGPAMAAPASIGTSASTSGTATATVLAPVVVTHQPGAALKFGRFTAGTGGAVVVSPAGSASATGGVALVPGSLSAADGFSVEGDPNRGFAIVTAAGSVSFAGASLAFTTLPSAATGSLNAAGAAGFTIGGTLTVPAGVAPGSYTGSYSVTVNYN